MHMHANSVDPELLSQGAGHHDKKVGCFENIMNEHTDISERQFRASTYAFHDLT